jgi:flagellar biosynthesis activator protein FlaF
MSISAYKRRKEAAEMPRELEQRAFTIVIGRLTEGKEKGGKTLIEACYLNQQLWMTLLTDLALPQNALPDQLKAQLISIGIWVHRYSPQVMSGEAPIDPLITVNRSILEGLSTTPSPTAAAPGRLPELTAV